MNKKTKNLLIIDTMYFCGLLIYSVIFFVINRNLSDITARLYWRQIAEVIIAICSLVYILRHIIATYKIYVNKASISFGRLFMYFLIQICAMLFCTIPFAIFDRAFGGDYIFPVWSTAGTLLIVIIVAWGLSKLNKQK